VPANPHVSSLDRFAPLDPTLPSQLPPPPASRIVARSVADPPVTWIAPPVGAVSPDIVTCVSVADPLSCARPPPLVVAELPLNVLFVNVAVVAFCTPPPAPSSAVLPLKVVPPTVSVPARFAMPAPLGA
jgi:hypothetical protein